MTDKIIEILKTFQELQIGDGRLLLHLIKTAEEYQEEPEHITTHQLAKVLGVERDLISKWIRNGIIKDTRQEGGKGFKREIPITEVNRIMKLPHFIKKGYASKWYEHTTKKQSQVK